LKQTRDSKRVQETLKALEDAASVAGHIIITIVFFIPLTLHLFL
jgi:hypothetical protein